MEGDSPPRPKKRKLYLKDPNIEVPPRTLYRWKKLQKDQEAEAACNEEGSAENQLDIQPGPSEIRTPTITPHLEPTVTVQASRYQYHPANDESSDDLNLDADSEVSSSDDGDVDVSDSELPENLPQEHIQVSESPIPENRDHDQHDDDDDEPVDEHLHGIDFREEENEEHFLMNPVTVHDMDTSGPDDSDPEDSTPGNVHQDILQHLILEDENEDLEIPPADEDNENPEDRRAEVPGPDQGVEVPGPDQDTPLYDGASLTFAQMQALLVKYIHKHHVNGQQLEDLLKLLDMLRPGALPRSKYLFKKALPSSLEFKFHYYCNDCKQPIENADLDQQCANCGAAFSLLNARKKEHYFIAFPVAEQLRTILEEHSPELLKKSDFMDDENFSDVLSSDIVKNALAKGLICDDDFTLTWGLDGAQAFKNSSVSYWPLLATVNEFAFHDRKRRTLLIGLWFGSANKPVMETFLKPFQDEFCDLKNTGFTWKKNAELTVRSRVFMNMCTCDAVAQPVIRNAVQFNGMYGCPKCYHPGKTVEKGKGHVRVYPYTMPDNPRAERRRKYTDLRTKESHKEDCKRVMEVREELPAERKDKVAVYGVRGPSLLMLFPLFTMVNFCSEYMHGVLLGVTKYLLTLWVDSPNHAQPWYIGNKVTDVDRELVRIRVPNEITRTPTAIKFRSYWKASEYRSFLLYYGPIVLKGVLPLVYYQQFMLLSEGVYALLGDVVTPEAVRGADMALRKFVTKMENLYGQGYITYNIHQLIHLAPSVRKFGPLWATSAFHFEGMNHVLISMKHGTQHTARQIAESFTTMKGIDVMANKCMQTASEEVQAFYRRLTHVGGYLPKNPRFIGNIHIYGREQCLRLSLSERVAIRDTFGRLIQPNEKVETYFRFSNCKFICHSALYRLGALGKRGNDVVELDDGKVCSVLRLVLLSPVCDCVDNCGCGKMPIVLVKHYEVDRRPFFVDRDSRAAGLASTHVLAVTTTNRIVAVRPEQLRRKCILIKTDGKSYAMKLVNSKESD